MNFYSNDCEIICDTKPWRSAQRITTMLVSLPRSVWSEFMTHRVFSRNAQSSRAIPVHKVYAAVTENPYVPLHWGKNQRGMQAFEEISLANQVEAERLWLQARDNAVGSAKAMDELGIHKQVTNRLLEPFQWHRGLVTSTMWDNFLTLRNHADAEPNIRALAQRIQEEMDKSVPVERDFHLPFTDIFDQDVVKKNLNAFAMLSAAKCARLSYLTYDGNQDWTEDLKLAQKLLTSPLHASTIEHQAVVNHLDQDEIGKFLLAGNLFIPFQDDQWIQFRKAFTHETADVNQSSESCVKVGLFDSHKVGWITLDDFFEDISKDLNRVLK
jgi:hypothetical protein